MTDAAAQVALGRFHVVAGAAEVEAFRTATGCGDRGGSLPLTFPMRWLMLPDIRRALMTLLPEDDLVPVHESQSFAYDHALKPGVAYTFDVAGHRAEHPDRLFATAEVRDPDGRRCAQVETILRLVSTRAAA